jgi:hypothetical protein
LFGPSPVAGGLTETISPSTRADAIAATGEGLPPPADRKQRPWLVPLAVYGFLAVAVLLYTGAWRHGDLLIDGPGEAMFLRILLGHWRAGNGIPAWIPDVWCGTPAWDLVGVFHLAVLLPLARLVGADEAVKIGTVCAQVAAAWGAFVLARALWGRTWPAVTAGLLYALHPFFASAGPLSGHEPSVWVFAATPWLAWSLRKALRREGPQYVAGAGLLIGFALLEQAEHAYSLALLCAILLLVELSRARRAAPGPLRPMGVIVRAVAVVTISFGVVAHWIVPFVARAKSFVLTPPEDVRSGLEQIAGAIGRRPQAFVTRAAPLSGTYDFEKLALEALRMDGAVASGFYLSLVCLALTLVTVVWLARRDEDDGTLSAILFVSAVGIWMSTGTVSIATGGLATLRHAPALAVLGVCVGLLGGNFLRRLHLGRWTTAVATVAAVLLFTLPFLTPITATQRLIPFLSVIRFPRLYPLAALGVALGAAFPITLVERWAIRRDRPVPYMGAVAAIVVMVAFLIDVAPYRSYYSLHIPPSGAAYQDAASTFAGIGSAYRVATEYDGDPETVNALLKAGANVSVGWPHPLASPAIWKLTDEAMGASPVGYRNAALGLSSTAYIVTQYLTDVQNTSRSVTHLQLEPNPSVLPMVRAYDHVAVIQDPDVAPELAVALASRNVGVVTGGPAAAKALAALNPTTVATANPCQRLGPARPDDALLRNELAMACSLHPWVGVRSGRKLVSVVGGAGAVFQSPTAGLQGVAVWLDGPLGATDLVLREVGPDGVSLGREILRTGPSGIDDVTGMTRFSFDPLPDSGGKTYAFVLDCDQCNQDESPQIFATTEPRGKGNLIVGDRLMALQAASFSPLYARMPTNDPSATQVVGTRVAPGHWKVDSNGSGPSLVVVAESAFPGWSARVDGKPASVVTADGAFLGVEVGPGHHTVALDYRRTSAATVGRAVTALTLVICLLMMCPPLRRGLGAIGRRRRTRTRRERSAGPRDALHVGAPSAGAVRERLLDP